MNQKTFIGIIVLFSLLRIVLSSVMGLMPQDAYYCYYGEHLSLSYFDHPPLIGVMLRVAITLFGKSAFALHFFDFIVTSGTLLFTYLLMRRLLDGDSLKKAFLLIVTAPFITLLCINSTPDVPLLFFWSLSLLLIHKALTENKWYLWFLGGLTSGLAFDSKYTAVFLVLGVILFLMYERQHRSKLLSVHFWLYLIAFCIAVSPVVIWNIQHDFVSLKYQSTERAANMSGGYQFEFRFFAGYFFTQLFLALPAFFLLIFRASFDNTRLFVLRRKIEPNRLFAASFAVPFFVCFTLIAVIYWVKINWLMPVYLAAAILVVPYLKTWKIVRWQIVLSLVLHLVAFVEIVWMPVPVNSDDTWWGWKQLSGEVASLQKKHPGYFVFSDDSYKTTAVLNFYLPEHVYAGNLIEKHAFQFAFNDRNVSDLNGRNAIYVTSERNKRKRTDEGPVQNILQKYFVSVVPLDSILLKDNGGVVRRKFAVYECKGYKPPVGNKLYP